MDNRAWLHLFGEGLVRTPDNFARRADQGAQGDGYFQGIAGDAEVIARVRDVRWWSAE
jgi:hypothetical protein